MAFNEIRRSIVNKKLRLDGEWLRVRGRLGKRGYVSGVHGGGRVMRFSLGALGVRGRKIAHYTVFHKRGKIKKLRRAIRNKKPEGENLADSKGGVEICDDALNRNAWGRV